MSHLFTKAMFSLTNLARCVLISVAVLCAACTDVRRPASPAGQIHQVGLVWLKNAGNENDRRKIIDTVHQFGREIPEVRRAVVGRTDGIGGSYSDISYDLCFILTFPDEAARKRYNDHPVHLKAAKEVFLPLARKLLFYRFVSE